MGKRLRPSRNILFAEVEGLLVILQLQSEAYFILDNIGTSFWKRLLENGEIDNAFHSLLEEYQIDPKFLEADLIAFVQQCFEKGFLVDKKSRFLEESSLSVNSTSYF